VFSNSAGAIDFGNLAVQPRLETGVMYYELEEDNFQAVTEDRVQWGEGREFSDWMPIVNGGLTFFVDRIFFDVSGQKAFDGSDSQMRENGGTFDARPNGIDPSGLGVGIGDNELDFDRWEFSLALGYAISENFAVYAGYKKAKTTANYNVTADIFNTLVLPSGVARVGERVQSISRTERYELEYDGPFVGATYRWPLMFGLVKGALAGKFGVALLNPERTIDVENVKQTNLATGQVETSPNRTISNAGGTTAGVNLGLDWIGDTPVKNLTYSVGIDGYQYKLDADEPQILPGGEAEVDVNDNTETVFRFRVGLAYSF
jgi:hypothetical protein